ncbi:MAG: tetratricopeptide repeat protein [Muribaculaceae bacterium]|nr:tetratricopeptide repeat protein [Muribaculaceae bacterium]
MKSIYRILISLGLLVAAIQVNAIENEPANDSSATVQRNNADSIAVSDPATDLDRLADEAYMRGTPQDYIEAIRLYNMAIEKDGSSAAIYYNLGNAYYRVDSLAKAIICYERALRLNPTDKDIRANLEFVNGKIIDAQPTGGISNIIVEKSMQMLSPNGWAVVSIVLFVAVLLLTAGYIFSRNIRLRKVFFFIALILLIVDVICIIITINASSVAGNNNEAIVTATSTQLSTSPSTPLDESQKAMLLHEGSKVRVIRELSTPNDPRVKKWIEVEVAGDNRAWIDAEAIEKI